MSAIAALAASALLAACAAGGAVNPEEGGAELAFESILSQSSSGLAERLRVVIRDEATWTDVWRRIHEPVAPEPPLPNVDFSRHMLIVVALGTRPSGGFAIAVQRITARDGTSEVSVRESCPARGAMVTMALTQPVEVVRLERRAETPAFRELKGAACR